LDLRSFTISSM